MAETERLARKLSSRDSVLLVIGSVFGTGIFLTSGIIAAGLPSPALIVFIWSMGGILSLVGSMIYAELGTLFPESGGPYVYIREAMGRPAAFVYGWSFFWIIGGGGIAALAMGFSEYFGSLVPIFSTGRVWLRIPFGINSAYEISGGQVGALGIIVILSIVNYLGIVHGARFQNWTTILRVGGLMVFAILGLFGGKVSAGNFHPFFPSGPWPSWTAFGAAFLAVIWTYDGWYAVNCTAEEIRDPGRALPRALRRGVLAVTGLYLLVNIVYIRALSVERMKGVVPIGAAAVMRLFGQNSAVFFAAFAAAAVLGCLSANILYCPRVAFAMARDGLFFKRLNFVHPRYRVPTTALIAQSAWAGLLCFGGAYQSLIEYVAVALTLFFVATAISLIVLRRARPEAVRPYRVWGYPYLPALFILANLGIFAAVVFAKPTASLAGLGLMASGWPAYLLWSARRRKEALGSGVRP